MASGAEALLVPARGLCYSKSPLSTFLFLGCPCTPCFRSIQVVNVRWFNATAWYGLELARLLNAAGHESRVVALADTETFAKAEEMGLRPLAMPLNAKNPLEFPGLIRDMGRLVRAFRPDVVNCHRGESFLFWGLLKGMGGYALVRTRGDQRLPKGNLPNRILHTRVADAVVATNSVMARHFAEKMRVPAERLHMILGGVDTERFRFEPEGRAEVRARYGFTDDECVVGLLGRFDLVKGQKGNHRGAGKACGRRCAKHPAAASRLFHRYASGRG